MSLGVGQLLLGSLMGGLLGNKEEEQPQQPTQVASNTQPQGAGGFMSNISNSLFKGMSQEQVYRMGQGFNTLRFEPDDNLHASFESRIKNCGGFSPVDKTPVSRDIIGATVLII